MALLLNPLNPPNPLILISLKNRPNHQDRFLFVFPLIIQLQLLVQACFFPSILLLNLQIQTHRYPLHLRFPHFMYSYLRILVQIVESMDFFLSQQSYQAQDSIRLFLFQIIFLQSFLIFILRSLKIHSFFFHFPRLASFAPSNQDALRFVLQYKDRDTLDKFSKLKNMAHMHSYMSESHFFVSKYYTLKVRTFFCICYTASSMKFDLRNVCIILQAIPFYGFRGLKG